MTQEDKELLIKDMCSRLPYGIKVYLNTDMYPNWTGDYVLTAINSKKYSVQCSVKHFSCWCNIEDVKPYLFPMSSMTKVQRKEYEDALTYHDYVKGGWTIAKSFDDEYTIPYWFVDFCNKNHLDYRGLIEKGLAIDATGLNIY